MLLNLVTTFLVIISSNNGLRLDRATVSPKTTFISCDNDHGSVRAPNLPPGWKAFNSPQSKHPLKLDLKVMLVYIVSHSITGVRRQSTTIEHGLHLIQQSHPIHFPSYNSFVLSLLLFVSSFTLVMCYFHHWLWRAWLILVGRMWWFLFLHQHHIKPHKKSHHTQLKRPTITPSH